jgi:GntR family transcriptional repressor for pyruvate dehydrogenase complex
MTAHPSPIKVPSLRQACIERLENLILSGELEIGERLPPERDLAAQLEISRPVLHEALVELAARGLVRILPRRGVVINDFRRAGSVAILSSLLSYQNGRLSLEMLVSMLQMRILLEVETARLAALHRSAAQLKELEDIVAAEKESISVQPEQLTDLDFQFHLQVAVASGNLIYPLIINSFKSIYTNLTGQFFNLYSETEVIQEVFTFHKDLVWEIRERNAENASQVMRKMLLHGQKYLLIKEN